MMHPSAPRTEKNAKFKSILSSPHFLNTKERIREMIVGMNPDAEKHKLYRSISSKSFLSCQTVFEMFNRFSRDLSDLVADARIRVQVNVSDNNESYWMVMETV